MLAINYKRNEENPRMNYRGEHNYRNEAISRIADRERGGGGGTGEDIQKERK